MSAPADPSAGSPPHPGKTRIVFVDIGRGLAALLVVYTHIRVVWMHRDHGISSPVTDAVSAGFTKPLHLVGQDLGQISVPFFFLASGFVITPLVLRQGQAGFAVNRFFRIYPTLAFAILLAAGAMLLGLHPIQTDGPGVVTPLTVLTNMTLANFMIYPQVVLLGVTWTLVVEMILYLLLILLLPVLRRATWLAIAIELTLVEVVMMTRGQFGPSYSLFAFSMSLATLPIMGQIIWAGYTRRIPGWAAVGYVGIAWSLFIWAKTLQVGNIEAGYPTAVALALLLFVLGMFAEPQLRQRPVWTWLSERTYSIYLVHGVTAFVMLDALYQHVPLWVAVPAALVVTAGVVEISYRVVERPSRSLGRSLARSLRPPRPRAGSARDAPLPQAEPGVPEAVLGAQWPVADASPSASGVRR